MPPKKGGEGGYTPFPCDKVKRHGRAFGWMFKALREGQLQRIDALVYDCLSWHRHAEDGQCNPSRTTIALDLGYAETSVSEISKSLTRLEAFGAIDIKPDFTNNKQTSNRYFVYDYPQKRASADSRASEDTREAEPPRLMVDSRCVDRQGHAFNADTRNCVRCDISYETNASSDDKTVWRITNTDSAHDWHVAKGGFDEETGENHKRTEQFTTHGHWYPWEAATHEQADGTCARHLVNVHRQKCIFVWCHAGLDGIEEAGEPFDSTEVECVLDYFERQSDVAEQ